MKGKIGVALIVIAFLVSLVPYMMLYPIPVFIIGVVLVWMSDLKVMAKAMWTFLPIAFWYPAVKVLYVVLAAMS